MLDVNMLDTSRMKYTFENRCLEESDLELNDGAKRIFLYTKGEIGTSRELKEMLNYIEDSREVNISSKELENIHKIVQMVKHAN